MLREFYLENAHGERLNLNRFDFEFLHTVKGLGYEKTLKVKQIGSHFEIVNTAKDMQSIPASVHFTAPNAYEKYFDFVQFCSVEPLTLIYNPEKFVQTLNDDTIAGYRRKCILTKIEKSGYTHGYGEMSCPVTFSCLTPWYSEVSVQTTASEAAETKVYNNYTFPISFSSVKTNTVEIISDSNIDTGSPCTLKIYGPITNPAWTLYVENKEAATGSVTATIPDGHYLVVDTINGRTIKHYDGADNLVGDLYQQANFNEVRFLMLKNGKNRITVTSQGGESVKLSLEAHIEYASV